LKTHRHRCSPAPCPELRFNLLVTIAVRIDGVMVQPPERLMIILPESIPLPGGTHWWWFRQQSHARAMSNIQSLISIYMIELGPYHILDVRDGDVRRIPNWVFAKPVASPPQIAASRAVVA